MVCSTGTVFSRGILRHWGTLKRRAMPPGGPSLTGMWLNSGKLME
jgi:hypothetical protein